MTSSTEPYSRSSTEIWIAAAGWLFCAIFFFFAFILRVAPAVMVDDLMREFSVGAAILGNLSAVYLYIYAGLQIPVGLFIDRHGLKNLIAFACAVTTSVTSPRGGRRARVVGTECVGLESG